MMVGDIQQKTLGLGFVLFGTRQHGLPIILRELVLPDRFDPVSPSFTARDGECCIGQNTCCPPGSRCLNNGKCEKIQKNIFKSSTSTLIPSISMNNNVQRPHFIKQNNEKENFQIEMSNSAKPAQRNILLL
ncbi:unnamed protein product [Schistosoma mattheei]|uniref:Uncharacterized protein n=1 Tax=Schistosoma mattheei TaxID=31246 RepID=A0A183PSM8_9TREM|nr:unnamed protein product [Schistosoma mattheei]